METKEKTGLQLFAEAVELKRKAQSPGLFFFGSRTTLWEKAAEKFGEAGNKLRLEKHNVKAGEAFEEAAEIQSRHLDEAMEAASSRNNAFKVQRKEQPEKAEQNMLKVIKYHLTKQDGFRSASRWQAELGEFYAEDMGDDKKAVEAYNTAGEYYEMDNQMALANKWYLKMADIAALQGDYQRAIAKLEEIAKSSIKNGTLRFSVKEYFMKAGICHLASGDMVATKRALQSYSDMDSGFTNPRERLLLNDLCQLFEEGDQEKFSERVYIYDREGRIDDWKTTMLLRVKNNIEKQEEDFS